MQNLDLEFIAHGLWQTHTCRFALSILLFSPSTMGIFVLYWLIRQCPVDLRVQCALETLC